MLFRVKGTEEEKALLKGIGLDVGRSGDYEEMERDVGES